MQEKIEKRNVVNEYRDDMTRYAITTNRRRSVPDARDGLKPVSRRILTALYLDDKSYSNKPHTKSSGVVGTVIKKYHPHGDTSIYSVLVDMGNWFKSNMPLVDSHGNYGSMQGDSAAAMRYTSARLSAFAEECVISELRYSKGVTDWVETFDNSGVEPEFLPAAVPLLLINGSFGIGVGMISSIPAHNLNEVIDVTVNLIKNPDAPVVLIPDQCMPCKIINTNWKSICNSGNGKYRVRGNIEIEEEKGIYKLVITSIPDMVTLYNSKNEGVIPKISAMIKDGKLPQITRLADDSNGNNLRYIIELKRGSDPNYVRDYLYKHTLLQKTFSVNFEVLLGIEPMRLSYKAYLELFIEARRSAKFRTYASLYQQEKTKWKEKQLYLKVMKSEEIDLIVNKIRKIESMEEIDGLVEYLVKTLDVTDLEAKYIINMDVVKLSPVYYNKYLKESKETDARAQEYLAKITNEHLMDIEIIEELEEYKRKYGNPRRSKVIKETDDLDIPKGEFRVVITDNNYIKKLPLNEPITSYRGDNPKFIVTADNTEHILLFDTNGKVFKYPIWKIPICDRSSMGTDIRILIKNLTSDIISMVYEPLILELSKRSKKQFLVTVSENNCIKKMDLDDFLTVTPSGIFYTKLNDGDSVKDINIVPNNLDIIIYSKNKALRVNMEEIPHYKRSALGVAAMNTAHKIDGISVIYPDATHIIVVTESGRVNKFDVSGMARSARYKAGSSVIKLGKTDNILSIYGVNDSNILRVFTRNTTVNIDVADIPVGSSVSTGKRMIPLKGDNIIKTKIFKNKK